MQEIVDEVRAEGAELVVCLSHNGFDVDKKMASQVSGIDVILTGHTHDALPEPVLVGDTILIASAPTASSSAASISTCATGR